MEQKKTQRRSWFKWNTKKKIYTTGKLIFMKMKIGIYGKRS